MTAISTINMCWRISESAAFAVSAKDCGVILLLCSESTKGCEILATFLASADVYQKHTMLTDTNTGVQFTALSLSGMHSATTSAHPEIIKRIWTSTWRKNSDFDATKWTRIVARGGCAQWLAIAERSGARRRRTHNNSANYSLSKAILTIQQDSDVESTINLRTSKCSD